MDAVGWAVLAQECLQNHEWEEGLLVAVPALVQAEAEGSAQARRASLECLRRSAAMLLPKEWIFVATDFSRRLERELGKSRPECLCVVGGALAVAATNVVATLASQGRPVPLSVLLCGSEAGALQPLLQRALDEASIPLRLQHVNLENATAALQRQPCHLLEANPSTGSSIDWVIFDVPITGISQMLVAEIAAAKATLTQMPNLEAADAQPGRLPTPCLELRITPLTVEMWALPVDGTTAEPSMHSGSEALDGLLHLPEDLCGFATRATTLHATRLAIPIDASHWRWTPIAPPSRLCQWRPALECSPPRPCWREVHMSREGRLSALIVWMEVEVAAGEWISRAPRHQLLAKESSGKARSGNASSSIDSDGDGCWPPLRPSERDGRAEPQLAVAFPKRHVRMGELLHLRAVIGERGTLFELADTRSHPLATSQATSQATSPSAPPAAPPAASRDGLDSWPALWHARMMNDTERSSAFEAAIRLAALELLKRPETSELVVLDVGCGAGLLTLIAARALACAGVRAAVLVGVEREQSLAAFANRLFGENQSQLPRNFRLRAIWCESRELQVGHGDGQLPRRADLIVSELMGDDPLAEGCLPTLAHAREAFLAQEGLMIPQAVEIHGILANVSGKAATQARLGGGLPDGAFGEGGRHLRVLKLLEPRYTTLDLRSGRSTYECASAAVQLGLISLCDESLQCWTAESPSGCTNAAATASDQPLCLRFGPTRMCPDGPKADPNALVSWFVLSLYGDVKLSSSPSSHTHWRQIVLPLTHVLSSGSIELDITCEVCAGDVTFLAARAHGLCPSTGLHDQCYKCD